MGQKIHPTGLRLGVTKDWKSKWYLSKDDYGDTVNNDYKIRQFIRKELSSAGVDSVLINRNMNKIEIEIRVARPGVVIGRGGEQIELIKEKLNKIAGGKVEVKVLEVTDPEISANLIANRVAEQLERRVVPKFIMSKEVEKAASSSKVKGVRIWVAGRIKGAEIARMEKAQWGNLPLQTLSADIDFAFKEAQVPNAGKHGIKVWVYKKEDEKDSKKK